VISGVGSYHLAMGTNDHGSVGLADGSVGERLGQAQAAAIRDVLTYLANKRAEDQKPTLEQE
jgi:hypothetical protein